MVEAIRFICSECDKSIEARPDGNSYYLDENGQKQYAYHPDHKNLARCIGNDSPHLCLNCGEEFEFVSQCHSPTCDFFVPQLNFQSQLYRLEYSN